MATFLGEAALVPVRHGQLDGFRCSTGTAATGVAVLRPEDLEVSERGTPATLIDIA